MEGLEIWYVTTKLVATPVPENRININAPAPSNSARGKAKQSYADATKTGQAKPPTVHTERSSLASHSGQPPCPSRASPNTSQPCHHSPHRLIVRWPGHAIPRSSTALTAFVEFLEAEVNPDYGSRRPHTTKISAANVTQSGNLVIHTKAPYTAMQLKPHARDIHRSAMLIPDFSPPDGALPHVELDVPWHGVVVHNLPAASLLTTFSGAVKGKDIQTLLEKETGIPSSEVRDLRVLCREGGEEGQDTLSLRIMLKDPATCRQLCREGAFLLGTHCRASQYCSRRRKGIPGPNPSRPRPTLPSSL